MQHRIRKFFAGFCIISLSLATWFGTPSAQAADQILGKNFTGFAFEKSALTNAMKTSIKSWILANASEEFTIVSCTGYTGFNANRRDRAFLERLARNRAKNVCDYVKTIKSVITISSTQGIPGNGKDASARKVQVRLIAPDGSSGGGGSIVVGLCDSSISIKMRSRISAGEFRLDTVALSSIATNCKGKVLDIYLLDSSGNQLASASDQPISGTSVLIRYVSFSPSNIQSNLIRKVAIEIREP